MELPMTRNNTRSNSLPRLLVFVLLLRYGGHEMGPDRSLTPARSQSDSAQTGALKPTAVQPPPNIAIGAGDQLDIEVFDTPELSGSVPRQPDRRNQLTVLGNIQVAGLTPNQAARKIEARVEVPWHAD